MWQARHLCGKDKSLNVSVGKANDLWQRRRTREKWMVRSTRMWRHVSRQPLKSSCRYQLKSYFTLTLFIIRSDWSSSACKSSCLYSPQGSLASGSSGLVHTKRSQSPVDILLKITKIQASDMSILVAFAIQEMQGVER